MSENFEQMVKLVRAAVKDVKEGRLSEGSLVFIIDLVVNKQVITDEDREWARKEVEKLYADTKRD